MELLHCYYCGENVLYHEVSSLCKKCNRCFHLHCLGSYCLDDTIEIRVDILNKKARKLLQLCRKRNWLNNDDFENINKYDLDIQNIKNEICNLYLSLNNEDISKEKIDDFYNNMENIILNNDGWIWDNWVCKDCVENSSIFYDLIRENDDLKNRNVELENEKFLFLEKINVLEKINDELIQKLNEVNKTNNELNINNYELLKSNDVLYNKLNEMQITTGRLDLVTRL